MSLACPGFGAGYELVEPVFLKASVDFAVVPEVGGCCLTVFAFLFFAQGEV